MSKLSIDQRDLLMKKIEQILDTRDKRYMFLKLLFPTAVSSIDLEGSSRNAASQIYFELEKRNLHLELSTAINNYFPEYR